MDDSQVLNTVRREIDRAVSFINTTISIERAAAYDYYYGRPVGNELEGRSQVVSADVAQAIDSTVPALVKIFCAGDKAVEFTPRGPEDVKSAEQATIGANYVFYTQNNGYELAHNFIKDGLLQKIGVFKWKWAEKERVVEKKFQGLDPMQFQMLAQQVEQNDGEITEHKEYPGPMGPAHDVTVSLTKKEGKVEICVPCPEEIFVSPDAEGLDVMDMPFICHRLELTKADLLEMGYSAAQIDELPKGSEDEDQALEIARDTTNGGAEFGEEDNDFYTYDECYIQIATGKGGTNELRKICLVANTILMNEVVDHIPMAIWTPKVMPHEVVGVSLADEVMDIQLLKTTIWRGALDNMYLSIAPRMFVQGDVNLDDVLTVKPGGVIRGEPGSALTPVVTPSLIGDAFQMLEYADQEEEVRTGISRLFQGIDPQSINKTATGVNALINQANARVELMARNAAEFGFKPLFKGILYLLSKHQTEQLMVRLTNNFVPIDPETWSKEYDMSCNVGLGVGTKDQQLMHLQALGMDLQAIGQSPFAQQLLDAKKVFNYVQKKMELAGFKDATTFVNDPEGQPPPPPPPPPPEIQKAQMEIQADQQKFAAQAQMDQQKNQQDAQLQMQKAQMDAELAKYKAELDAQVKIQVEQMKAQLMHDADMKRIGMESQLGFEGLSVERQREADSAGRAQETKAKDGAHNDNMARALAMLAEGIHGMKDAMSKPKTIIRGKDGRAIGVQ